MKKQGIPADVATGAAMPPPLKSGSYVLQDKLRQVTLLRQRRDTVADIGPGQGDRLPAAVGGGSSAALLASLRAVVSSFTFADFFIRSPLPSPGTA